MAINIEMNIRKDNNSYDVLYPKTLGSLVSGKVGSASSADSAIVANGLSNTLAVSGGGTGQTSQTAALGNLIYNASSLSSGSITTSTRIGATTGSTAGKYITMSNLVTYLQNNLSVSNVVQYKTGSYTGNGSSSRTVTLSSSFPTGIIQLIIMHKSADAFSCYSINEISGSIGSSIFANSPVINEYYGFSAIFNPNSDYSGLTGEDYVYIGGSMTTTKNKKGSLKFSVTTNSFSVQITAVSGSSLTSNDYSYNVSGLTYYYIALGY